MPDDKPQDQKAPEKAEELPVIYGTLNIVFPPDAFNKPKPTEKDR